MRAANDLNCSAARVAATSPARHTHTYLTAEATKCTNEERADLDSAGRRAASKSEPRIRVAMLDLE